MYSAYGALNTAGAIVMIVRHRTLGLDSIILQVLLHCRGHHLKVALREHTLVSSKKVDAVTGSLILCINILNLGDTVTRGSDKMANHKSRVRINGHKRSNSTTMCGKLPGSRGRGRLDSSGTARTSSVGRNNIINFALHKISFNTLAHMREDRFGCVVPLSIAGEVRTLWSDDRLAEQGEEDKKTKWETELLIS